MDWIKVAKDLELKQNIKKYREEQQMSKIQEQTREEQVNWLSRVMNVVQKVGEQGLFVNVRQRANQIELSRRGTVIVEQKERGMFDVLYHDVGKATKVSLNRPVTVRHHRLVHLGQLDDNNIEEIVKFAALGIADYSKIARYSRVELNLHSLLGINKVDEHV